MLNIAICDDNPSDIELLEKYISEYMSGTPYTIKTYPDGEAFLNDLPTVPLDSHLKFRPVSRFVRLSASLLAMLSRLS